LVDLDIERKRHVVTHQLEAIVADEMGDVALGAGEEIVDADEVGATLQQALAQMRAEKAGTAGHQNALFEMHGESTSGERVSATDSTTPPELPSMPRVEEREGPRWRGGRGLRPGTSGFNRKQSHFKRHLLDAQGEYHLTSLATRAYFAGKEHDGKLSHGL